MEFRKDINGLRGVAVLAVVLYHFSPKLISGGFVGVDVFFVISGYLMTSIIFRQLESNSFSLMQFYTSRVNRIIPALAFLCLVLCALGWLYLDPFAYKSLGKHVASSISFLSNFIYWRESGYFEASSYEKWLLHTWSLSVEWQFYMVYPATLLLFCKFFKLNHVKYFLVIVAIFSFSLSFLFTSKWPTASYFLLHTRAWEMLLGGLAFLYPLSLTSINKQRLSLLGLILIVASCLIFSSDFYWPGYLAVIPVIGTFFIIQAYNSNGFIARNIFLQRIGDWSYSIYLWHWPLVVAGIYFKLPTYWVFLGIACSVFLGYLSYTFVESYKYNIRVISWSNIIYCRPIWFVLLIIGGGSSIFLTGGALPLYSDKVNAVVHSALERNPYNCMTNQNSQTGIEPCIIGNKSNIAAVIVGDSHADALITAITSNYNLRKQGVVAITKQSCPLLLNAKNKYNNDACYDENPKRMKFIKDNYSGKPIYVISRLSGYIYGQSNPLRIKNDNSPAIYFDKPYAAANKELLVEVENNLEQTICNLALTNPVFLTTPIPEMRRNVPQVIIRDYLLFGQLTSNYALDKELYIARNKKLIDITKSVADRCAATIIDPTDILCDSSQCISNIEGKPIYYDGDHISEFGNEILSPLFTKSFN